MTARLLLALLFAVFAFASARGQTVVTATSDPTIWIHPTFTGETITLFGNIEPDATGALPPGPYDVVVVIRGPVADRVVRRSTRQFGLILNSDYALYRNLPSFYRVLSSRPLSALADGEALDTNMLTLEGLAAATLVESNGEPEIFSAELVRLMEQEGLFAADARGVQFLSPTFFSARVALPANVPNGNYLARTLVFSDGELVAQRASRFFVRTEGFERFLAESARDMPLPYGLATVLVAIFTGWLGGVLFRR